MEVYSLDMGLKYWPFKLWSQIFDRVTESSEKRIIYTFKRNKFIDENILKAF